MVGFFMQNILIWKLILTSFFDFEVYCVMDQIAVTPILLMGAYINFSYPHCQYRGIDHFLYIFRSYYKIILIRVQKGSNIQGCRLFVRLPASPRQASQSRRQKKII